MPPAQVLVICALSAISYIYAGRPVVRATKKASMGVCRVMTVGHKCKPPQPTPVPTEPKQLKGSE